jgi:sugar/nucleoside kinase (ribokinase family)
MDPFPGTRFDYVTVGHVTRDAIDSMEGGTIYRPGGSAFYSALQAARLGLRTLIVTQGVPTEIEALLAPYLAELDLRVIPAEHTTTLSTRGMGAERSQRVLAWAGPIVEPLELDAAILHLAPIARETPVSWAGRAAFVGITPQGLVRQWEQGVAPLQLDAASLLGDIPLVPPDSDVPAGDISEVELDPSMLPERFDAAVISEHECASCHKLFSAARHCGAHVVVTAGARPTTVHMPSAGADSVVQTSTPPIVAVRDDIGAGDVFAAAFFVALADKRGPLEAATFANAAASVRIAGVGPSAIGARKAITP